jgi:hypothetical protein
VRVSHPDEDRKLDLRPSFVSEIDIVRVEVCKIEASEQSEAFAHFRRVIQNAAAALLQAPVELRRAGKVAHVQPIDIGENVSGVRQFRRRQSLVVRQRGDAGRRRIAQHRLQRELETARDNEANHAIEVPRVARCTRQYGR